MSRTIIHQELSPDGQTRVTFFQRADATIVFLAEKFWIDDLPEDNYYNEFWAADSDSRSIFDNLQTAIREARVEYPWLTPAHGSDSSTPDKAEE